MPMNLAIDMTLSITLMCNTKPLLYNCNQLIIPYTLPKNNI